MRARVFAVVEDSSQSYVTQGEVDDWLNEAYLDIVARLKLLTTEQSSTMGSAGTSVANGTIDLATDAISVLSVRLGTDDARFVDDELFWSYEDEGGVPENTFFRVFNDKIELYPKPSDGQAFRVRYVKKPTALSLGTDSPAIQEELQKKMVRYAQAHARLKEGHEGQSDRYMAMYEDGLPPLTPRNRMTPGPLVMQVAGGPWDTSEARHL